LPRQATVGRSAETGLEGLYYVVQHHVGDMRT
jgi:hypothetical protein